jgi:hypothetical protein
MAITKVGRDGILSLTIFSQYGSMQLAKAIDNETIEFFIVTREKERVRFSILSYNPLTPEVKIKLNFTDPKVISSGMVSLT